MKASVPLLYTPSKNNHVYRITSFAESNVLARSPPTRILPPKIQLASLEKQRDSTWCSSNRCHDVSVTGRLSLSYTTTEITLQPRYAAIELPTCVRVFGDLSETARSLQSTEYAAIPLCAGTPACMIFLSSGFGDWRD